MSSLRGGRALAAAVVAAFAAQSLLARALGIGFDDTGLVDFWQLLDPVLLRSDLLRSVWYLHSQPPLFNLAVGAALEFGAAAPAVLAAAWQAMALGLLATIAWLMRCLRVPVPLAALLVTLFALHPTVVLYSRWLFYPLPVALLLAAAAAALVRFLERGRAPAAHAFAWLCAAVMLTRATFHPLWFALVLGAVAWLAPGRRRRLLVAAAVPFLVVNLWYAKNLALVGAYTGSSWLGMNLRHDWPAEAGATLAGRQREVWLAGEFRRPEYYRRLGYFGRVETPVHPALDAPYKANGTANLNHRDYARLSREMGVAVRAVMAAAPGLYLRRVGRAVWQYLQPGPRFVFGRANEEPVRRWIRATNGVFFLGGLGASADDGTANLLFVLFPAALGFGALGALRGPAAERAPMAFLVLTIAWAAVVANLSDLGENDRMRFETDPLTLVLVGAMLAALWRRISRRRTRP